MDRAATSSTQARPSRSRQLGVDGPVAQPEGAGGVAGHTLDGGEDLGGLPRRGDIEGLLEVRAVEWLGLVEHREHVEPAAAKQPFDGDLVAGDVLLDQQRSAVGDGRRPLRGRRRRRRAVGPDHSLAARPAGGLHDPRPANVGQRLGVGQRRRSEAGAPRRRGARRASRPCRGCGPPPPAGCGGSRAAHRPGPRRAHPDRRPPPPRRAGIGRRAPRSRPPRGPGRRAARRPPGRPSCRRARDARRTATTTSTPRWRAAARKSAARYVAVGRRRSARGTVL